MTRVTVGIAQKELPNLIEDKKPVAEIVPIPNDRPSPKFGSAKGRISMSDDFDEPVEDFDKYTLGAKLDEKHR